MWRRVREGIDPGRVCSFFSWRDCLPGMDSLQRKLAESSEPAVLVGWSLGGLVALRAASVFPAGISGMVLVGATSRMTAQGDYPGVAEKLLRGMILKLRRDRRAVLRDFAAQAFSPGNEFPLAEEFLTEMGSFDTADLIRGLEFLSVTDARGLLEEILLPVRILHGYFDHIISAEQGRYLNRYLSNSTLKLVDGGGHALPYTHPQKIIEEIEMLENARGED